MDDGMLNLPLAFWAWIGAAWLNQAQQTVTSIKRINRFMMLSLYKTRHLW